MPSAGPVFSITPGSPNVFSVSARARAKSARRLVADEVRWSPCRGGDVLAARCPHEVLLRLEHVVHQRPDVPPVARRRGIELRSCSRHLGRGPLARASVQIKQIEIHRLLLSAVLHSLYPDRGRCMRSPGRGPHAAAPALPRHSRRRSVRTACCPRWRARWRSRTSTPRPWCARRRKARGSPSPVRSQHLAGDRRLQAAQGERRVGRRPDAEVDGADGRHQRAHPGRALVEERVLARRGVPVVEVHGGLERARPAGRSRTRAAPPSRRPRWRRGPSSSPRRRPRRRSGRPRRPARRARTGPPGPCTCPR